MSNMERLTRLEERLGVAFKDKNLLREAVTHRSYLNEHPKWPTPHNERLEFLGDAVLELIVTEALFRRFPTDPEGQLTVVRAALVNYRALAEAAGEVGLEDIVYMSHGERGDSGRAKEAILANAVEALIGALYLDQGPGVAEEFIKKFILTRVDEVIESGSYRDPKSELQELIQEKLRVTPTYTVLQESGPAHERHFRVGVCFGEKQVAEGEGASKQEAEIEAARRALEEYRGK